VSDSRWPFAELKNSVAFVTSQVLDRTEPILHVVHDKEGEWQFIGETDGTVENAKILCLHEAVRIDPAVLKLAELPIGWHAVRESPEHDWRRELDGTPTI
jgi:hypothetical protein